MAHTMAKGPWGTAMEKMPKEHMLSPGISEPVSKDIFSEDGVMENRKHLVSTVRLTEGLQGVSPNSLLFALI